MSEVQRILIADWLLPIDDSASEFMVLRFGYWILVFIETWNLKQHELLRITDNIQF